jgi:hypothetical protein
MNRRLYAWSEAENKLHDTQGGFRPGRRCADQLFTLRETVSERRERGKSTYLCYVDVRKAYDKVWRDGLWLSLWRMGMRSNMYRMIKSMFSTMRRQVTIEGGVSAEFGIDLGVAQGAVTSPFLYAAFINSLLVKLADSGAGVTIDDDLR